MYSPGSLPLHLLVLRTSGQIRDQSSVSQSSSTLGHKLARAHSFLRCACLLLLLAE